MVHKPPHAQPPSPNHTYMHARTHTQPTNITFQSHTHAIQSGIHWKRETHRHRYQCPGWGTKLTYYSGLLIKAAADSRSGWNQACPVIANSLSPHRAPLQHWSSLQQNNPHEIHCLPLIFLWLFHFLNSSECIVLVSRGSRGKIFVIPKRWNGVYSDSGADAATRQRQHFSSQYFLRAGCPICSWWCVSVEYE